MNGAMQAKLSPVMPKNSADFSEAKVKNPNKQALDSTAKETNQTSFQDLLMNSNADTERMRQAQKNAGSKTNEEFAKMLQDKANRENLRKPQNDLDKDAFMKLFVTQLQAQDPLNPSDNAEMASQLAQFHGLEQMLNVNKNLEKMQNEAATARAVSLINFVGKDVQLDGGKLKFENDKVSNATFNLERDVPEATLEVRDSAGVVVASEPMGSLKAGDHDVKWSGLGKDGKKAGGGVYSFAVLAKDMQGQNVPVKITSTVQVTGVDLHDSGGAFYTELGKVKVHEVASVGETEFAQKAKKADAKPPAPAAQPAGAGANANSSAATSNAVQPNGNAGSEHAAADRASEPEAVPVTQESEGSKGNADAVDSARPSLSPQATAAAAGAPIPRAGLDIPAPRVTPDPSI